MAAVRAGARGKFDPLTNPPPLESALDEIRSYLRDRSATRESHREIQLLVEDVQHVGNALFAG